MIKPCLNHYGSLAVFLLAMAMVVYERGLCVLFLCYMGVLHAANVRIIPTINDFTTDEFVVLLFLSARLGRQYPAGLNVDGRAIYDCIMQQVQIVGSFLTRRCKWRRNVPFKKHWRAPTRNSFECGMWNLVALKSLAASGRLAEFTAIALSVRSLDRQTGNANIVGVAGALG